jgi:hypothetical protein
MGSAMRLALKLHPDCVCEAVTGIEVEVVRTAGGELALRYFAVGAIDRLAVPPAAGPARVDGLWEHTCFEAFVRSGKGYYELNFSPAGEWAIYRLEGYRSRMSAPPEARPPLIATHADKASLELTVTVALGALAGLAGEAPWQFGISAVIEEVGGRKSYWALAHPPGKADFHHPDSFALQLGRATS